MVKFHLTDDGPKLCVAQDSGPGCRYIKNGEPHFDSKQEAQAAFEARLNARSGLFSTVSGKDGRTVGQIDFSSFKGDLTLFEAEAAFRVAKENFNKDILKGEMISASLLGSYLYGLNTETSDRDILVISDAKSRKGFHHVFPDGLDIKVSSVHSFADAVMIGQPNEVDLLFSGRMIFGNSPYRGFIESLRFNTYSYIDRVGAHIATDTKSALRQPTSSDSVKRNRKSLKTAFRNTHLMLRVVKDGYNYRSFFTEKERERFYYDLDLLYRLQDKREISVNDMIEVMEKLALEAQKDLSS